MLVGLLAVFVFVDVTAGDNCSLWDKDKMTVLVNQSLCSMCVVGGLLQEKLCAAAQARERMLASELRLCPSGAECLSSCLRLPG